MAEAPTGAWHTAWADALSQLEVDLAAAEELLAVAHLPTVEEVAAAAAWHPPVGLGALPAPLEVRARSLLDRQLAVARRLAEAAAQNRRQVTAAEAMRGRPAASPVFVDTQG